MMSVIGFAATVIIGIWFLLIAVGGAIFCYGFSGRITKYEAFFAIGFAVLGLLTLYWAFSNSPISMVINL
ncbi:hypothetical protein [Methylocucumis oryzae]|uniref:Uncharacterized protein n=1 Tax=Methylocucumis oryzae TaxID=1632867 RepID=A0A0F3IQW4_9GAMM|nr:hypothetical protein [Methylocucumis oryzae]KJV07999.1 hypothetical protein VZ94_00850 [Methylocucumis oryzae]